MKDTQLTEEQRRRVQEAFEHVPFAHLIGLELGEIERGTATLYLNVRDELKQNNGLMHGGAIASLIDTASAFAILPLLEPAETISTIDLTIHYLRPLLSGRASALARLLRQGRRRLTVSVDVLDDRQTLAATAVTTYIKRS
ncbi:MAG TPA: PaaI family thioesterase [Pyrinomonadaceae bacterium]